MRQKRTRGVRPVQDSDQDKGQRVLYDKSWAVVVGINNYAHDLPPLRNAQNDAQAIAEILSDHYHFDEVHTLYNEQATRRAIMSWLRDKLPAYTQKNDRVIFFFAGHGVTQTTMRGDNRGYLAPYDAENGEYADYIDMRELVHACAMIEAKHILIILDCCFSGVAAVAARSSPPPTPKDITDIYLRRITEEDAWQILTAGDSDDLVADSSLRNYHHSVFTSVLLEALKGAADYNNDHLFTATDLAAYVKPLVTRESAINTGRSQTPFFNYLAGSGQGDFVFELPPQAHIVFSEQLVVLPTTAPIKSLNPREQEIVRLVSNGHPNKAIARQLAISQHMVNTHIRRIFDKLGVSSRAEMVAYAFHSGLLFPSGKQQSEVAPETERPPKPIFPIDFDWVAIPAGKFLMGSHKIKDSQAQDDELPQHQVYLPEYCIARVPVTNAQYKKFVEAAGHQPPSHWKNGEIPKEKENHPVVNVSWHNAQAFCRWAGVRLPTEAEWEKAARGTDGRFWPWGNERPTEEHCNFAKNVDDTTPVGTYTKGASPYGVWDMAGNVWECTSSLYQSYPYQIVDDREDPKRTGLRTLRGGSFSSQDYNVRCAARYKYYPNLSFARYGFRVVSPGF